MSKDDAINLMKNSDLKKNDFFLLYIKMDKTIYYQRNREKLLNRANDYYKNNQGVLEKK